MTSSREHYGIVGGGLLGMTLALRLAQRGQRVTLLEAADHLGGLADAWQLGDITWDRHYHVTLLSDACLRSILSELGLGEQMQWVQTKTGFFVDGRLHSLSNSWEFFRFPPLGLLDKLRLGWTIFYASKIRDWQSLENVPVADWLARHSGRRTLERIWLPLLKSKLGEAYRRTSAAFIWATIARMYAARRSGMKREMFGYLPGGYSRLLAAFRTRLEDLGVEIRTSAMAQRVYSEGTGRLTVALNDDDLSFDRIVITAPAGIAARLCPALQDAEQQRLREVEYLGIVCASIVLRRPLSPYYVTNITDDGLPFTGVIEMTALVDPQEFGGRALVYLPKYVACDDPLLTSSDAEIRESFLAALTRMHSDLQPNDVLAFRVSRCKQVFALSTLGYSQRVPPVTTSVPGLFVVNSSQIVNGTLNVNETVRLAEESLPTICAPMSTLPSLMNDAHHAAAAS